jgi:histidyl-tRNA synthetase
MSASGGMLNAPRGMRDFYPEDMVLRNALFDAWKTASAAHGFVEYDACVVETFELLKRKAGEEIVDQIYDFVDKKGRRLALRPEMTPTLARMVAARHSSLSFPLKWFTIAQCFRYERMSRGRKREHYQWNLDIIGEESVAAEAELMAVAVHALGILGLGADDVSIRFSSRKILGELLEKLGIEGRHHAAVFLALDKKGKIGDGEIEEGLSKAGLSKAEVVQVFGLLEIADLDGVERIVVGGSEALAEIRRFLEFVDVHGMGGLVEFDISVVRGLAYYTGIVFEAFDRAREFRAVLGGGRYDNLLKDVGGKALTGVGLGFGDVVIGELLAARSVVVGGAVSAGIYVGFMEEAQRLVAMSFAVGLRAGGSVVDLALRSEKAKSFFARASRDGAAEAAYIGPDDVVAGEVLVKDLVTRQERKVRLSAG